MTATLTAMKLLLLLLMLLATVATTVKIETAMAKKAIWAKAETI